MITTEFVEKENHLMNCSTIYYFKLNGENSRFSRVFDNEIFGIVHCDSIASVIEFDGYPVNNENLSMFLLDNCIITGEIIRL